MDQKSKVAEIFSTAGEAFKKVAELGIHFHPVADSSPGVKWSEDDIEILGAIIERFSHDLNLFSEHIRTKTISQMHAASRRQAFEEAGLPVPQVLMTQLGSSSEVTPNTANASVSEEDVEGSHEDVKKEDTS